MPTRAEPSRRLPRYTNRHSYMREMREAIEIHDGYLAKLLKN